MIWSNDLWIMGGLSGLLIAAVVFQILWAVKSYRFAKEKGQFGYWIGMIASLVVLVGLIQFFMFLMFGQSIIVPHD